MKKLLGLSLFTALLAGAAPTAFAQSNVCYDRSNLVEALVSDYGEQLAEVHEIKGRGILEFHVSPTEGTWTAVVTDAGGTSCVLATGEGIDGEKSLHMDPGLPI